MKSMNSRVSHPKEFALTRWSVVVRAAETQAAGAEQALDELCRAYWYPLYAFVRRQGHAPADAQDLTQAFFAQFLAKKYLKRADPARGRFRTFLLACLRNFLANEWDRAHARKRGGDEPPISIDEREAESRYRHESVDTNSPDRLFERRWALTLIERVLDALQREYEQAGRGELFEQLKTTLSGDRKTLPYGEIAAQLHMNEGAVKVAVHRLRKRYKALFRQEIAQTVERPEDIEEELRHVVAALAG
jgi:RNA polymerase sigma factor (sigma-70 family)